MSQTNALNQVRGRKFIVGSIDTQGYFSIASRPFAHDSAVEAGRECNRLAVAKPGTAYIIMQLAGGCMLPAVANAQVF